MYSLCKNNKIYSRLDATVYIYVLPLHIKKYKKIIKKMKYIGTGSAHPVSNIGFQAFKFPLN